MLKSKKQTTSIQPTIDGINGLLRQFGFSSFSTKSTIGNSYKLQRPNGTDAKTTLSEGERDFCMFSLLLSSFEGQFI